MLRVIAGQYKGRRLFVPENSGKTRPTLDRVKECAFNIMVHQSFCPVLRGARVLDLFAGSGSLGLEALSRGAERVTFVDTNRASFLCLKRNFEHLQVENQAEIVVADTRFVKLRGRYDIVLIDPPYYQKMSEPTLANLCQQDVLSQPHIIFLEMAADEKLILPQGMIVVKEVVCGPGRLYFLQKESEVWLRT